VLCAVALITRTKVRDVRGRLYLMLVSQVTPLFLRNVRLDESTRTRSCCLQQASQHVTPLPGVCCVYATARQDLGLEIRRLQR